MRFNLLLLLIVMISSCAPMYVPNTLNVPLFRGQGEFQASAFVTTGADLQGAYAVSDHVGIMADYATLSEKPRDPQDPTQSFNRKRNYFETGIGYYTATKGRRLELYVGYGQGKSTTTGQYIFLGLGQQERIITGNYRNYFIQPSIGTNNRGFNIAFTPRFSFINFYKFTSGGITETPNEKIHLFIEPALTARFRMAENLNGMFQLGLNVPLPSDVYFDYAPVQAAFGIQLHLGGSLRNRVY